MPSDASMISAGHLLADNVLAIIIYLQQSTTTDDRNLPTDPAIINSIITSRFFYFSCVRPRNTRNYRKPTKSVPGRKKIAKRDEK